LNDTTVTGTNTLFTSELAIGDFISAPDGNWYEVIELASDTSATLYEKYPSATASGHSSQKLGVTDTGAAAASSTQVQVVNSSGNSKFLYISGGWDLSTETQTGQTWFRQMHGTFKTRNGYGLYISDKNYINLDKLNFLRYNYGIYYSTNSNNNTITSATCNSNNGSGIYYYSSSNNTITSATCNSNGSGIYYYSSSNNNTITSATCNSNNNYGIYYYSSNNNTITSATCNSNGSGIYYYTNSNNNTITSATCNSNNGSGISYSSSSNNTITSATCNSNNYGIYYASNSNNNTIYALSTTGNTTAGIYADIANNICHSATIAESTKVAIGTTYYTNTRQYINNLSGYSYVYSNYATANSQNASAGGTGKEWKFAITNAARDSVYPFYIPIARVAVASSGKVTVKVYFKKSGTGIAGALRCRYGQITWSDAAQDIIVACPDNTSRNQVTLEFTPTEAGVVEIEAGAWYTGSITQTVIIDDIEITQA